MKKNKIMLVVILVIAGFFALYYFKNGTAINVNFFKSKAASGDNSQFNRCINNCRENKSKCEEKAKKGANTNAGLRSCLVKYSLCLDACYNKYPPIPILE